MELCLRPWRMNNGLPDGVRSVIRRFFHWGVTRFSIAAPDLSESNGCFPIFLSTVIAAFPSAEEKTDLDVTMRAGELFDLYGNSILRLAYSYLHNREDAEDVLQNTLIKYMETAPLFFSKAHEKAWMLTVASNLSKNLIKRNKVRDADELLEELVAEEKEDLAFVWEAAKKLPDNQREAVHLFYQEGYSTREIAGILKRKEATVRSDLKRGRERMKEILENEYGIRY